eukprot:SAG11_NODE_4314_length_1952_cov_2.648138_1_plen_34_part_10
MCWLADEPTWVEPIRKTTVTAAAAGAGSRSMPIA